MNRWFSGILFLGGLVVLGIGVNAANSVVSETSSAITGAPTDKALWMMIGGGVVALVGLIGLCRRSPTIAHS